MGSRWVCSRWVCSRMAQRTVTAQKSANPARTSGGRFAAKRNVTPVPANGAAALEIALPADLDQRKLCDEYGELDRRLQLMKRDVERYEVLKKAIKSWFDRAPADADGTVEGDVYHLHVSARERERRVRDMHLLVEAVGLEKVLELANVPLGAIEDLIGKTRLEALTVEARTGSRRIKAVPKYAVRQQSAR
jgi:hypothetical protein